jgi:succinate dehydrogenase / fumarate reductase cytochrome b subunit
MIGPYYKPQLTSMLSIVHRITGVALVAGAFVLVGWLVAVMRGPEAYATFAACIGSLPGRIVLAGFLFALVYHFFNGIRHLFWDAGRGFTLPQAYASGWTVVALTVLVTALICYFGFAAGGAA